MQIYNISSLDTLERELADRQNGKKYAFEIIISEEEYESLLLTYEKTNFYGNIERFPRCFIKLITSTYASRFIEHDDSKKLQELFIKVKLSFLNESITVIPKCIIISELFLAKKPEHLKKFKINLENIRLHSGIPICYINDLYKEIEKEYKNCNHNAKAAVNNLVISFNSEKFGANKFSKYFKEVFVDEKYKEMLLNWLLWPINTIYYYGSDSIKFFDGKLPIQIIKYFSNSAKYRNIAPKLNLKNLRNLQSGFYINFDNFTIEKYTATNNRIKKEAKSPDELSRLMRKTADWKQYLLFADNYFMIENDTVETDEIYLVVKSTDIEFWQNKNFTADPEEEQFLCNGWSQWIFWQIKINEQNSDYLGQLFNLKIKPKTKPVIEFSSSYQSNCLANRGLLNGISLFLGPKPPEIYSNKDLDMLVICKNLTTDEKSVTIDGLLKNIDDSEKLTWSYSNLPEFTFGNLYHIQASLHNLNFGGDDEVVKAECLWLCGAEIDLDTNDILFADQSCKLQFKNIDKSLVTVESEIKENHYKSLDNVPKNGFEIVFHEMPDDRNPIFKLETNIGDLKFRVILPYLVYEIDGFMEKPYRKKEILEKLKQDIQLKLKAWCFKANLQENSDIRLITDTEICLNGFNFRLNKYQDNFNLGECSKKIDQSKSILLYNSKTKAKHPLIIGNYKEFWNYDRIKSELEKIYLQTDKYFKNKEEK